MFIGSGVFWGRFYEEEDNEICIMCKFNRGTHDVEDFGLVCMTPETEPAYSSFVKYKLDTQIIETKFFEHYRNMSRRL